MGNQTMRKWEKIKGGANNVKEFVEDYKEIFIVSNAIATVILGIFVYLYQTAQPDIKISFTPKDHTSSYAPMLLPNSKRGFNPSTTPVFVSPSTTRIYKTIISNDSDIKAKDVIAEIQLKKPFVICLISFDENLKPEGTWKAKYNTAYNYCKIELGTIGSKGKDDKVKFLLVYSYPINLEIDEKTEEKNALTIIINSSSLRGTIKESFGLEYWKKGSKE